MKKNRLFLVIIICLFSQIVDAQKSPVKWGEVKSTDLNYTDESAPAVVLCDFGTLTIGPRTIYTRHVRIKILNEEGLKYANAAITYKSINDHDVITDFKAQTLNERNGSIQKTKVKTTNTTEIDRQHSQRSFDFPEAKVGSILEYKYTLVTLDLVKPSDWVFRHPIPCLWSEFNVNVPDDFFYLVTFQNQPSLSIEEQKDFVSSLNRMYAAKTDAQLRQSGITDNIVFSAKDKRTTYILSGKSMRFVKHNQPAYSYDENGKIDENSYPLVKTHLFLCYGYFPFWYKHILMSADEDYDSWNRAQIKSKLSSSLNYVNYYLPTWREMNDYWFNSSRFGQRYKRDEDIVSSIIQNQISSDSYMTLSNIHKAVQNAVKWNGEYSMYAEQTPKSLIYNGEGSSGDINILLLNAYQQAGFDAVPVLVKTTMGTPENLYPVRDQFNHVVVKVTDKDKVYYIDGINEGKSFVYLNKDVIYSLGWVAYGNGEWVDVENIDEDVFNHPFASRLR